MDKSHLFTHPARFGLCIFACYLGVALLTGLKPFQAAGVPTDRDGHIFARSSTPGASPVMPPTRVRNSGPWKSWIPTTRSWAEQFGPRKWLKGQIGGGGRSSSRSRCLQKTWYGIACITGFNMTTQRMPGGRVRFVLPDSSHAGHPPSGTALVPRGERGGGTRDRHRLEERSRWRARHGAYRIGRRGREDLPSLYGRDESPGTLEAHFRFPAGLVGISQLRYTADTPIGSAEFTQAIRIEDKVSILLTTEKPIYQPGQTIHVRALALDRANHDAAAHRKLTFEVEDSRGNKVFKKATETDAFGVASAEFGLADEVNLGAYHLRALMGNADAPTNTAELAVNVERYVLPKFKVAIEFSAEGNKRKHGYRPGDHVVGTVRANYFFGKPVEGGEVTLKASTMDVTVVEVASTRGKTDSEGSYHFDFVLPAYFAGRPLSHGAARVLIEAAVKDSASHTETRGPTHHGQRLAAFDHGDPGGWHAGPKA